MQVDVQVELPGSHGVHLDEGDAAAAPLRLRLVDGEEGPQEQVGDALADALGVSGQAGQQVLHRAHVPKLARKGRTTDQDEMTFYIESSWARTSQCIGGKVA